jgi:hypothetical protein
LELLYTTGAISAGEDEEAILINIDESASTGGDVNAIEVLSTAEGSATVHALETSVNVGPIFQQSGSFVNPGFCEIYDDSLASFTDCVTAAGSTATDVQLWVEDDDVLYFGAATTFEEIEMIFETAAANPGIKPTFEFWSGAAWTTFSPADGSNGGRNNGVILWTTSDLSGWATTTVDGDSAYWIRITRTQNTLTGPTEDKMQTAAPTNYYWDKDGSLSVKDATIAETITSNKINLGGGLTAFVLNGVSLDAIVGATSAIDTELHYIGIQHSNTAAAGSRFMFARSRGTFATPLIVADNDSLAAIDGSGFDGTDYVLATQIDFEVDGTPGGNDMPGKILFKTTADGGILPTTRMTIDSTGAVNIAGLTASEIVITDASKNLISAAVATYPSLTELSYVKGVTSAIQTQVDNKLFNNASDTMTGTLTADGLTLGANENITLGAQTLDHDGTDFVFNDSVKTGGTAPSTFSTGLVPNKVTSDPCAGGGYAEGAIFYNDTSNYWCGCDGTNDVKLSDTTAACF